MHSQAPVRGERSLVKVSLACVAMLPLYIISAEKQAAC
jgi:hypothetical protein